MRIAWRLVFALILFMLIANAVLIHLNPVYVSASGEYFIPNG